MKCIHCGVEISDGSVTCCYCGANQQDMPKGASKDKSGVLVLDCQHCGGTGECNKGVTRSKIHSCEFCVAKSGIKPSSLFPHVPCAYCKNGKVIIDLKLEKPKNEQKSKQGKGK